jgi:wyosine [tRNA(Phe)-imidazoG37] synthetase (radical SAM superfamily)
MSSSNPQFSSHPRRFQENLYVYPVLSRRAGGISIGVNLNRDQFCNFRCIYCQVDRKKDAEIAETRSQSENRIDLPRLAEELNETIKRYLSGDLLQSGCFRGSPETMLRLNDIALSGDGEPTACPDFAASVAVCAEARKRHRLDDVKLVLITNATLLNRPAVEEGLKILDANNGEIWAKLDAGTEAYYRQVDRSPVPWPKILENLQKTARTRPIVIQTLFMRIHGQSPSPEELAAYIERLREIRSDGGRIKLVQVHTIARYPAEPYAEPLTNAEVDRMAQTIQQETQLPVAAYYGM